MIALTAYIVCCILQHAAGRPVEPIYTIARQVNQPTPTASITSSTSAAPNPTSTSWQLPSNFSDDLPAEFNFRQYEWGDDLVSVLSSLPTSTAATTFAPQPTNHPYAPPAANSDNVLQVKYPQGSIDPSNSVVGGVGFYGNPLNVTAARNLTLQYSVYFPADFDFVQGGKLPGLYGGHEGCSGGKDSDTCFSTRLMWRPNGLGELYLYLPKSQHSASLCSTPPASECNTVYGYSIARGAWIWKRGQWTDVKQDIWLNSDGQQNGGVNIWINGELVLYSNQIEYFAPPSPSSTVSSSMTPAGYYPTDASYGDVDSQAPTSTSTPLLAAAYQNLASLAGLGRRFILEERRARKEPTRGFLGIMMQTFFGGHDQSWASPRDQYTYFNKFALIINA